MESRDVQSNDRFCNRAVLYTDNDPFVCAWLEELIRGGHLPDGEILCTDILSIQAGQLIAFRGVHFFAGIGGWPLALKLAGYEDLECWTGSCPCQPFSAAGKQQALQDERDLWPAFFRLIAECRPPIVFGEQVEAAIRWGWLDRICDDLGGEDYTVRAEVWPACSVGSPHIRNRLFWVAIAQRSSDRSQVNSNQDARQNATRSTGWISGCGKASGMAIAEHSERGAFSLNRNDGRDGTDSRRSQAHGVSGARGEVRGLAESELARWTEAGSGPEIDAGSESQPRCASGGLGNADAAGSERWNKSGYRWALPEVYSTESSWSASRLIHCRDGKWRRVEPSIPPLAYGLPRSMGALRELEGLARMAGLHRQSLARAKGYRVGSLQGYGNAIVVPLAVEFIKTVMADLA